MTTLSPDLQTIPLNRLVQSQTNVRRTGRSRAIEALMASIEAHGLRQNLNVKPTSGNRFEVVAGGRRLEALRRLMKEGRIGRDAAIPCVVLTANDNPAEISLAENALREAMHPDDQCEAFHALVRDGMSQEDVAARFGITPAVVRQRLKLASVSPALRTLFRKGDLDLSQMMAFTLIDDHAAQEALWAELPEWNRDADAIRRSISAGGVNSEHRLARLVGLDAYESAGGQVLRDLFDEEQPAILTDSALLERLAVAKLEEAASTIRAEGWSWVDIVLKPDYATAFGRVYPAHDSNEAEGSYEPADLARAGARITLDYDGEVLIERGLVHPDTLKAERRVAAREASPAQAALSDALIEDLSAHRTAALRLELAKRPDLGLACVVHALGLRLFYEAYGVASCLELSGRSEPLAAHVKATGECTAHDAFAALLDQTHAGLPDDPAQFWTWCKDQDRETLLSLLGLLAALSVDAVERKGQGHSGALRHASQLAEALSLEMRDHWSPKPDVFFARLPKSLMTQLLSEQGEPQQAAVVAKLKKAEAAQRVSAVLLAKGWLPTPLLPVMAADRQPEGDDDGDDHGGADHRRHHRQDQDHHDDDDDHHALKAD